MHINFHVAVIRMKVKRQRIGLRRLLFICLLFQLNRSGNLRNRPPTINLFESNLCKSHNCGCIISWWNFHVVNLYRSLVEGLMSFSIAADRCDYVFYSSLQRNHMHFIIHVYFGSAFSLVMIVFKYEYNYVIHKLLYSPGLEGQDFAWASHTKIGRALATKLRGVYFSIIAKNCMNSFQQKCLLSEQLKILKKNMET